MADLKYGEITEKIIGASFRVHNGLGCGFQEVIYQRALEIGKRFHWFTSGNTKCQSFTSISTLEQDGLTLWLRTKSAWN